MQVLKKSVFWVYFSFDISGILRMLGDWISDEPWTWGQCAFGAILDLEKEHLKS